MPGPNEKTAPRLIALFDSVHSVLAAEAAFKGKNLWCDIAPSPREITPDCGVVLVFRPEDIDEARSILLSPPFRGHRTFEVSNGRFKPISLD